MKLLCFALSVLFVAYVLAAAWKIETRADFYAAAWPTCVTPPDKPLLKRDRMENNVVIRSSDRGMA